jgi:hypothetical protein
VVEKEIDANEGEGIEEIKKGGRSSDSSNLLLHLHHYLLP